VRHAAEHADKPRKNLKKRIESYTRVDLRRMYELGRISRRGLKDYLIFAHLKGHVEG